MRQEPGRGGRRPDGLAKLYAHRPRVSSADDPVDAARSTPPGAVDFIIPVVAECDDSWLNDVTATSALHGCAEGSVRSQNAKALARPREPLGDPVTTEGTARRPS
ncbi:MAG TPA: hypothetical protein VHW64_12765 [Nocardioides sp.]|jgi:hypothetical protein|uniref:hypothetical protein n=1 Tax=Nocardioides sp. TaxID=35761 RepID=UPI002E357934|nr:hypothetical protein [Nocardioides sp.]HEX3931571.1 hypothetical protein [Nocardioides sp.]